MTKECPQEFIDLAHRLANTAGDVIRPLFRQKIEIIGKDDASPVTIADRNAEAAMREIIEAEYPEHGIFGEEHGEVRTDAEYVWVLDPIDGTLSFISGCPTFGCLIGLTRNGVPILGILDQVISGERWIGVNGKTTLNGEVVKARSCEDVSEATLFSWGAELFDSDKGDGFKRLYDQALRKRFGYDCYAYALLSTGFVDIVADCDMKPYDYCGLVPIIENAGGKITDWEGNPLTISNPGYVLAAATTELHNQIIKILA
ncbi:histidinol-phosphatase [Sneathiella marina]|uniref:Histidinol-phosphatase n=1 Tax=Sneathiella marina TaxID=2950108 RepID=A0ABY4W3G4_9PROT|nr:histidinol-phosphatase [Sneathiella marina]USG61737.1 histidinol-phosphatase [Sneathiella marina]